MMSKLWRLALHEYRGHVWTRGFLLAVASVPLLIAAMVGLGAMTEYMNVDRRPVGYVDLGGWLNDAVLPAAPRPSVFGGFFDKTVQFLAYQTEEDARSALEEGAIQAYYVLASDYLNSSHVELVYSRPPGDNATEQFPDFLRLNLLAGRPPEIVHRAVDGGTMIVRTPDGSREFVEGRVFDILFPILSTIFFMILFMATASTLMQAVVQEKENRTMEILATSASPGQIIGGKVLAVVGMGLTLLICWIAVIALSLLFAGHVLNAAWARQIHLDVKALRTIVLVAIPSYVLYCALMAAVGSTVADVQESQQISGLAILLYSLPFYAIVTLIEQPNSPLAVGLSLFPLTALTSLSLRTAFGTVPTWQLAASTAILSACALGAMWLAARAFRLGMLRYGQRLSWQAVFRRGGRPSASGASPGGR